MNKLHLGCGHEILPGFINLDSVALPGVDVVHDLRKYPWPFERNAMEEILLKHVLEHMPEPIPVMEELWRISKPGAKIEIHVPYWNSSDFITDPTHMRAFNENTFDFFDPTHWRCQERPYYSKARFEIQKKTYFIRVFGRYLKVRWGFLNWFFETLAHFFCNVIQVMVFELKAVKNI